MSMRYSYGGAIGWDGAGPLALRHTTRHCAPHSEIRDDSGDARESRVCG